MEDLRAPAASGALAHRGEPPSSVPCADGRQGKGHDLIEGTWPWRDHPGEPWGRYGRWRATSPTSGAVTIVMVDDPGQDRFSLLGMETTLRGPQRIRRWRRRHWSEVVFRVLKHLLATESCQAHREDADYGHLGLRLRASVVLFYTSRVVCQGRRTMAEILFSLKPYGRFGELEALALQALSSGISEQAACIQLQVIVRKSQYRTTDALPIPAWR